MVEFSNTKLSLHCSQGSVAALCAQCGPEGTGYSAASPAYEGGFTPQLTLQLAHHDDEPHGLQENGRSQAALDRQKWEGPCNERLVGQLLADLKGWGVDLESLKPSDLFDTIKGRTLW